MMDVFVLAAAYMCFFYLAAGILQEKYVLYLPFMTPEPQELT